MTNHKPNDVRVVPVELLEHIESALRVPDGCPPEIWKEVERTVSGYRAELRAILAQPADQQGEPDFYEVSGNGVRPGLFYTHPDWAMEDPRYTVTPHWRSVGQPATAKVVLPGRMEARPFQTVDRGSPSYVSAWNACLDEVAKLNGGQS